MITVWTTTDFHEFPTATGFTTDSDNCLYVMADGETIGLFNNGQWAHVRKTDLDIDALPEVDIELTDYEEAMDTDKPAAERVSHVMQHHVNVMQHHVNVMLSMLSDLGLR